MARGQDHLPDQDRQPAAHQPARAFRRDVLRTVGVGALALGIGSGTVSANGYESVDYRITSWDGTELDATLHVPESDSPHAAVIVAHGWGGNRHGSGVERTVDLYASAGYVALSYDTRGFGDSEGEADLNGPKTVRDVSALIDWLAYRPEVATDDDGDPLVGMDGFSMGGAIQPLAAIHDDRIDAIVPRSPWFNYLYSIVPNGVIQTIHQAAVAGLGTAASRGVLGGEPDAENLFYGIDSKIYEFFLRGLATERYPDDGRAYMLIRSASIDAEDLDTPALFIHGWLDSLLPPNQSVWAFHSIRRKDVPTKLVLFDAGHAYGENEKYHWQAALNWMDEHVRGIEGASELPPVSYVERQMDEWAHASAWPPRRTKPVVADLGAAADGDSSFVLNPVAPASSRDFAPTEETSASSVNFDFPLDNPMELVGTPAVSLSLEPQGTTSFVFVGLSHVTEDGSETRINDYVTPFRVDVDPADVGSVHTVGGELQPRQRYFEEGDTLRVTVETAVTDHQSTRHSAGVFVHHSQEHPSTVTVPVDAEGTLPSFGTPGITASRSDDGIVFTAGQTNHVELSVAADRPVKVRDSVPASWSIVAGDPRKSYVEDNRQYVEFRQPTADGERDYFAAIPESSDGRPVTLGPIEYFEGGEWRTVPGTTETDVVVPASQS